MLSFELGAGMKRREFVTLLGGAAIAWPFTARAQSNSGMLRVTYIWFGNPGSDDSTLEGLQKGLQELGYVDGTNIKLAYYYANGSQERLGALLAEIVKAGETDILVSPGTLVTSTVKKATSTIPVVSVTGDPIGSGIVDSIARPGGNITGFTLFAGPEMGEKWLELMHEAFPGVSRIAFLWNPSSSFSVALSVKMKSAADRFGFTLISHELRQPSDLAVAFEAVRNEKADGIITDPDPLLVAHRTEIVEFAANLRCAAVYSLRDYVAVGGLMSYDASLFEIWRQAAGYVDRIAKGAKPGDLPIQQPTKIELTINLKTAKSLGLTIPGTVLARADKVIE
jgi:putative tryptophan/tyrosine transport system substrate-binding protein